MKIINIILCPPTDNLAKAKIFKLIIQIMDYESIEASKVLNTFTMKCLNELNLLSVVFKMIKIHRDHEPLLQHGVTLQSSRCGESCGSQNSGRNCPTYQGRVLPQARNEEAFMILK